MLPNSEPIKVASWNPVLCDKTLPISMANCIARVCGNDLINDLGLFLCFTNSVPISMMLINTPTHLRSFILLHIR